MKQQYSEAHLRLILQLAEAEERDLFTLTHGGQTANAEQALRLEALDEIIAYTESLLGFVPGASTDG